jgi:hypothetical protein
MLRRFTVVQEDAEPGARLLVRKPVEPAGQSFVALRDVIDDQ